MQLKCNHCDKIDDLTFFVKDKRSKTGYVNTCKLCKSVIDKQYRNKYKTELSNRRKKQYAKIKKPISHDIYVNKMNDDPILWRATVLRNGMYERSKKKNMYFDKKYFTIKKIQELLKENNKCPSCSCKFIYKSNLDRQKGYYVPSADRFINTIGYTKENTVFICWRCNDLKHDATISDLKKIIDWLEKRGKQI